MKDIVDRQDRRVFRSATQAKISIVRFRRLTMESRRNTKESISVLPTLANSFEMNNIQVWFIITLV